MVFFGRFGKRYRTVFRGKVSFARACVIVSLILEIREFPREINEYSALLNAEYRVEV